MAPGAVLLSAGWPASQAARLAGLRQATTILKIVYSAGEIDVDDHQVHSMALSKKKNY
ncbi:hypothetical protein [Massilia phosphatilytica]